MGILEEIRKRKVFCDGGMGSLLQARGLKPGELPETWNVLHPEILKEVHLEYLKAGCDIVTTNTFGANGLKFGSEGEFSLKNLVTAAVENAKAAIKEAGHGYVALDLGPTGKLLKPLGDLAFTDACDLYKEVVSYGVEAGADLVLIETMSDGYEAKAAVLAAKESCDLPVFATMIFDSKGKLLTGGNVESTVALLEGLGVDALGINCGLGPVQMMDILKDILKVVSVPVIVNPNAGLPRSEGGKTVYDIDADEFARYMAQIADMGANVVGGCCGTTPEHIKKTVALCKDKVQALPEEKNRTVISSYSQAVVIDKSPVIIGERINPTGKKKLQAELKEGSLSMVRTMATEQEENGAQILDINMGMNGIDEKQMMLDAIYEVTSTVDLPLCIDSSHVDIIEAALRIYPGRALVNSISLEKEKIEYLLPIAKKYGAMFILLPLSDEGLPKDSAEKHGIIREILRRAEAIGMGKEDIVVDGLVATIGANPKAALECFETFSFCKNEMELPTVCGLSNISFGLPERSYVNTAFLTMAIGNGLTMAIANPSQELLMNAAFASDMLLNKEESGIRYIGRMNYLSEKHEGMEHVWVPVGTAKGAAVKGTAAGQAGNAGGAKDSGNANEARSAVFTAVLKGNKNHILDEVKHALDTGEKPDDIINGHLIPAINEVGELFDKQKYFLPQLISSANTMKVAIEYLEPMLARSDKEPKATLVVATVEGDIHDIGKNLVVLMLKNYGYHVIDLGKDVPADLIVDTAMKENARVIGLSALMTTTMMRMKDVVELVKERGCTAKVVIGGAAITESFAEEIGADGYSKDAAECVKLVDRLLEEE